jgi:Tfp pilus tip-associated adhesin PilY1
MLLGVAATPAYSQLFDPVNDDTDLFMMNPNITGVSPNVLIIADNTANWNQVFLAEKTALAQVVGALNENVNIGMMLFNQSSSGACDGPCKSGAYPLYGVRPVGPETAESTANRTVLTNIVNAFDGSAERGNTSYISLSMYEAYAHFKGITANAGHTQTRRDYTGNSQNPAGALSRNPFSSSVDTTYTSPITNECQKNYIIYISNGPTNEPAASLSEAKTLLDTFNPGMTQILVPVNGGLAQTQWADEYALALNSIDLDGDPTNGVRQNVRTYTVEVDPVSSGQGPEMTALLKSMANQGSGKYFGVSSGGGGADLVTALKSIFAEIQSVNSVFAAATLPISVNVRGTNLNQVYVGMFRPDPERDPRWFGNLKLYKLAFDDIKGIFLSDASIPAKDAVNAQTGFITQDAISFWTAPSTFWGFRPASENGVGGASDSPDGDLIEKGGVAQQLRVAYATDQSSRNVYTCTSGCTAGSLLSATPFATSNTDIHGGSLGLTSKVVDPLTALQTKAIASLTDRLSANLLNATGGTASATLSNGGTTLAVTSLSTADTQVVTMLDARPAATGAIGTIQRVSGKWVFVPAVENSTLAVGHCLYFDGTGSSLLDTKVTAINGTGTYNWNGKTVTGYNFDGSALGLPNSATFSSGSYWQLTSSGAGCPSGPTGTVAKATVANLTYAVGDTVTIAGASPTAFNGTFSITSVDTVNNIFTYGLLSAEGLASPAVSGGSITVTATSTTATAMTGTIAHGYVVGDKVAIYGADPDPTKYYDGTGSPSCTSSNNSYNGLFTVSAVPNSTTFRFKVACPLPPNTSTSVRVTKGAGKTVTVTTALPVAPGDKVIISGANPPEYNGTFTVTGVGVGTFTYDATEVVGNIQPYANLPQNTSSSVTASANVTGPTVTVTALNHSLGSAGASVNIIIEGSDPSSSFTNTGAGNSFWSASVVDANTLTYNLTCTAGIDCPSPSGTYTVRTANALGRAYAYLPAHGYNTGDSVIVTGANPTGYNGTFTITKIDDDNFTYTPAAQPDPDGLGGSTGANTASAFASIETTTAVARSVGHGFANGDSVTISGASPTEFNGTFTITKIDDNTFSYTISTKRGNATGIIRASVPSVSTAASDNLINWVRGMDNFEDENRDGSLTDVRSSIHGDVLHSQPTVVNYNRFGDDNDIFVFYGSNDGTIRAVKGGYASATGQILPGREAWSFVAPEFFTKLSRQQKNFPSISSSNKRDYFADGNFTSFVLDSNADGVISAGGSDKAYLYTTMRRGGRFIYAFNVTDPEAPRLLWKIDNATAGFAELGQTWSQINVIDSINASSVPVAIFGAGYDATVEDIPAANITGVTADTVTTASGTFTRTMGRGIYIINAETGALIWRALGRAPGDGLSAPTVIVSGMDCSIASDVAVLSDVGGFVVNRGYVGDTCGNLWRVDFADVDPNKWMVTKVAAIGNWSVAADRRKFMYPPDVVTGDGYDAVLAGTGDREHPFDTTVNNRMYMFKDRGTGTVPVTGDASTTPSLSPAGTNATLTETDLADVTTDCIQDATACPPGVTPEIALDELNSADGWFIRLETGEKVVSAPLTIGGTTSFNTNLPTSATSGTCSNLGEARVYQVDFRNASAVTNYNTSTAGLTAGDRYQSFENGGFLPSGVPFVLDVGNGVTKAGECIGVHCREREGVALQTRMRTYWYKETD